MARRPMRERMNLPHDRGIAWKAELEWLRRDRAKDLDALKLNHPSPPWVQEPEHPRRQHMRIRERRINLIEKQLEARQDQARDRFQMAADQPRSGRPDIPLDQDPEMC